MPADDAILDAELLGAAAVNAPKNEGRAIASSMLWQVASQAIMAVLSIVATKFVAIGLSKELAGYYNSSYGYLQIFAILADFGLYAVSVREVSRAQNKERVLGALLFLRSIILIFSLGIAFAIVWSLPAWRGTPFPMGATIAALVPFFTLLSGMLRTVFQVQYRMHFVFVAEVLQRVVTTIGIGLFILAGVRLSTDIHVFEWFLWIGGLGAGVLFLASFIAASRLMKIRFCADPALLRSLLLLAAPYGLAYLFLTMYRQLDVAFIALLRPDFALQNAAYGFAGRVEDMAFLIPTFLLNSILPLLSQRAAAGKDSRQLLGKTLMLLLLFGSIFCLFSFFWARPLTLLFATRAYLSVPGVPGSDVAFKLMSLPMFLNGLILFCFYVFLAHHRWKRLIASFGVGVIVTIALNLLWTRPYGFPGAASALILVHLLLTALLLPQALRLAPAHITAKQIVQWLLFTLVLGVMLWLLAPHLQTAVQTLIAGIALLPILLLLGWALRLHIPLSSASAKD